jgi:CHAT domain-containing protein
MAITVTPALSLTDLTPPSGQLPPRRTLLAGATHFRNGLAPLPMAAEELQQLAALHPQALVLLDDNFNTRAVLEQTQARSVEILHLATHAEFTRQSANSARVYTSDGELSLAELGRVLRRQRRSPLALFVLNACRTAMGDEQNELGIAGLALQAGATSALGNLWYVDDVVTAAFSVQFHRALQQGLPSDEALRRTQRLFRQGAIQVRGDRIVSSDGAILLSGLSRADQARLAGPLTHPYFWAGAILSGKPW